MNFFLYFCKMPFPMDILSLLRRRKITQADLSRSLDTTPGNVSRWVKGEGVPSYELCRKLLQMGMTVEELFGLEYAKIQESAGVDPLIIDLVNSPQFADSMKKAMQDLKDRGLIK